MVYVPCCAWPNAICTLTGPSAARIVASGGPTFAPCATVVRPLFAPRVAVGRPALTFRAGATRFNNGPRRLFAFFFLFVFDIENGDYRSRHGRGQAESTRASLSM